MMNLIVEENLVSFKEMEQKIFAYVCELGREITQIMLEAYDKELAEGRDKKVYRSKGSRRTTIKTVYGEVEYSRRVYRTQTEDGQRAHVFLLDQAMQMDKIGLISTNLAEKIAMTGYGSALPGHSRHNKPDLRAEHKRAGRMEHDATSRRTHRRGRIPCSKADECRPERR